MTNRRLRLCIVTPEVVGPFKNGGIGTHCYYLVQYLASLDKYEISIIYSGQIQDEDETAWKKEFREKFGAEFYWVRPGRKPGLVAVGPQCFWDQVSQEIHQFLRTRSYDVLFFQEMLGGAFRTLQARKNLGEFSNTLITCMTHSSWQWINESMQTLPAHGLSEMFTKYMERYCVRNCDLLLSPSRYMLEWSRTDVPDQQEKQKVLPYLCDTQIEHTGYDLPVDQLIFFGRLEHRKGLILFLEVLLDIAQRETSTSTKPVPVFFLGKSGFTPDGGGIKSIRKYSPLVEHAFSLHIIDDLGHHEAMDFLRSHRSALVVCPSIQDNLPYAIIENILLGTNIISCRTGGIPELFADQERLADPTVASLGRLIQKGLAGKLPKLMPRYSLEYARECWSNFCNQLPTYLSELPAASSSMPPKAAILTATEASAKTLSLDFADHTIFFLDGKQIQRFSESSNQGAHCEKSGLAGEFDVVILVAEQITLFPQAVTCLEKFAYLNPGKIGTSFLQIQSDSKTSLFAPLGDCMEGSIYGNTFGTGLIILPSDLLPEIIQLVKLLEQPSNFWPFLGQLLLAGNRLEVVPERLAVYRNKNLQLHQSTFSYQLQNPIFEAMSQQIPVWAARLLRYAAASELLFRELESNSSREIFQLKQELGKRLNPVEQPKISNLHASPNKTPACVEVADKSIIPIETGKQGVLSCYPLEKLSALVSRGTKRILSFSVRDWISCYFHLLLGCCRKDSDGLLVLPNVLGPVGFLEGGLASREASLRPKSYFFHRTLELKIRLPDQSEGRKAELSILNNGFCVHELALAENKTGVVRLRKPQGVFFWEISIVSNRDFALEPPEDARAGFLLEEINFLS
jgi:glycosyltransferase involved in cell wall biosynthesis